MTGSYSTMALHAYYGVALGLAETGPFVGLRAILRPPRVIASALQRALPIGILGLALIGAPMLIFEPQGLPRMRALEQDVARVEADNIDLRRDVGTLRVDVRQLRDDPAAVERIARSQLGLVRKNEIVFQFSKSR